MAVRVQTTEELATQLEAYASGKPPPGLKAGFGDVARHKVALVFGGQGSAWSGMGRDLLANDPAARAVLERCDHAFRAYLPQSIIDLLRKGDEAVFERPTVQFVTFSMQLAITAALRARGVVPAAVVGQSMGELAAACVAGALTLEEAVRVLFLRNQATAPAKGTMLVVGLSMASTLETIAPYGKQLAVSIQNSPESTVISGDEDAIAVLRKELQTRGTFFRLIPATYGSHSPLMDPFLPVLHRVLGDIRRAPGELEFWSTVTGGVLVGTALSAEYWGRNLRDPVLLQATVTRMAAEGFTAFVEVDPHPVLAKAIRDSLQHFGSSALVTGCGERDEPESHSLLTAMGELFAAGVEPVRSPIREEDELERLFVVSGKTQATVDESLARLRAHVDSHPWQLPGEIAFNLLVHRTQHPERLAFVARGRESIKHALDALKRGQTVPGLVRGRIAAESPAKVVFVFPGQGAQWLGMGRQLVREEPTFAKVLGDCDAAIEAEAGWSVLARLEGSDASWLQKMDVVQPVLFAMEVALAELWRSWGVTPDAVIGHSMGEVAAACVAGALSLADAAAVICRRSSLVMRISGKGEMAQVGLSIEAAERALVGYETRVSVAVNGGPRTTVIAGDPAALGEILAKLEGQGVFCRRVQVAFASHSPQVDPLMAELSAGLNTLSPMASKVAMFSTVTGQRLVGTELLGSYWSENLRRPVRFAQVVQGLVRSGHTAFVEMGPHPLLTQSLDEILEAEKVQGVAVGSTRRDQPERLTMLESLGSLYVRGQSLDAGRLFPAGAPRVELPTYPWQRQRHWVTSKSRLRSSGQETGHPLLGLRIPSAGWSAVYESLIVASAELQLAEMTVGADAVVSAATLCELLRAAGEEWLGGSPAEVTELQLEQPLVISAKESRRVQVVLDDAGKSVTLFSQPKDSSPEVAWTPHARGKFVAASREPPVRVSVDELRVRCERTVNLAEAYSHLEARGVRWSLSAQRVIALQAGDGEALAELAAAEETSREGYGFVPVTVDGAFQALLLLAGNNAETQKPLLPSALSRFAVYSAATATLARLRLEPSSNGSIRGEIALLTAEGEVVAEFQGIELKPAKGVQLSVGDAQGLADAFYRIEWRQVRPPAVSASISGRWLVVGTEEIASALAGRLQTLGAECSWVTPENLAKAANADHVVWLVGPSTDALQITRTGLTVFRGAIERPSPPRLWWVTQNAVSVLPKEDCVPAAAAAWGLGRTVIAERPEFQCTLIDVSYGDAASALLSELAAGDGETQVAWRGGERHVARLVRAFAHTSAATPVLRAGTVLITGGLGAVGQLVARQLAADGVQHLLLTGRRGIQTPGAKEVIAQLEALGATVTVAAVDAADSGAIKELLRALPEHLPLRGVVHAAGIFDDALLKNQTEERVERTLAPKVLGAWALHQLTRDRQLDFFILFSSMPGALCSAGQGAYAAANAYLDALSAHRRAHGLPAQSLAWGLWAVSSGMVAALKANQVDRLTRLGFRHTTAEAGMQLFKAAMARPDP
ncbi:MAG: SDR family NAD(P)-dependent oxidoreductase, partial [Myxococcaceae bacterium]